MKEKKQDGTIKIAIVGLGINGIMHLKGFSLLKDCSVVAICDTNKKAQQNALNLLGDKSILVTSNYKELCKIKELDAVCISTPTYLHVPIALTMLEAGKHIFLEKPIAPTIEECDLLIERAFETDKIVQVGLVYRYSNLYRTVAKMVERGDFNNVMMAYCKEYRDNFPTQWFFETKKSGGAILDKNCHHFDLFNWYIRSKAKKVYAIGGQHVVKGKKHKVNCAYAPDHNAIIKNPDIVDNAFVLIEYENEARANLGLCMYEVEPIEGLEIGIIGDNGAHLIAKRDATLIVGGGPLGEIREVLVDYQSDNKGIGHIGSYVQHVEFIECIKLHKLPFANLLSARPSMTIAMAAEKSIKEGREVFIKEFDNPTISRLLKIYEKELLQTSPEPLPAPRPKKEKKLSREQLILNTFIDLIRLLIGKRPRWQVEPFGEEIIKMTVKKFNASQKFKRKIRGLTTVLSFEYPDKPKVFIHINNGEMNIIPPHQAEEKIKIIFSPKGWENLQLGDSPYKLFLTGQIRAVGDVNKLMPYADAFIELSKMLGK